MVRLGLPRIIRLKENAPELDYRSFHGTTGPGRGRLLPDGWTRGRETAVAFHMFITVLVPLNRRNNECISDRATGKNGACWLARPPRKTSLLEIYRAGGAPKAFAIHQYPVEKRCPARFHIKSSLSRVLYASQ